MRVARLRGKSKSAFTELSRVDRQGLYMIAGLPDDLPVRLSADPRPPSPRARAPTPLDEMSTRDLVAALRWPARVTPAKG